MATADDYAAWIIKNQNRKGTPEFDTVAQAYKLAKADSSAAPAYDPSAGGSTLNVAGLDTGIPTPQWLDRVLAGMGKAVYDTGRGIKQIATLNGSQGEVNAAHTLDAPLMNTGAGVAGNVLGQIGTATLPGAAIAKGAQGIPMLARAGSALYAPQTVLEAAAGGALQGAVQPVPTGESRTLNAAIGAAGGAALPTAVQAGSIIKGAVSPFFQGGREQIAGRALQRFATDPNAIAGAAGQALVKGSTPTLAEATGDIGLAQLQRSLRNNPDANAAITNRLMGNQQARLDALQGIAGDPGQREFFDAARQSAASQLYQKAFDETPAMTPWIKGQLTALQKRPSFQTALPMAQDRALEEGLKLDPSNVTQVVHYTKMALDDMIGAAKTSGRPGQAAAIQGTRDKLVSLIESKDFSPSYREARDTYAQMSKPINQMDVGQELYNRLQPALADFGATGRLTPQKYAEALRNGDMTARKATGFSGAKLDNILSPEQMATVTNVARDMGRSTNAQELGMAKGSPTAQNLAGQDILRNILGPLGLPKGLADTAIADTLMRPVSWAYKAPETRILGLLGDASIDPAEAKRLVELARKRSKLGLTADQYIPYSAPIGAAGLLDAFQK